MKRLSIRQIVYPLQVHHLALFIDSIDLPKFSEFKTEEDAFYRASGITLTSTSIFIFI